MAGMIATCRICGTFELAEGEDPRDHLDSAMHDVAVQADRVLREKFYLPEDTGRSQE